MNKKYIVFVKNTISIRSLRPYENCTQLLLGLVTRNNNNNRNNKINYF